MSDLSSKIKKFISFTRELYQTQEFIPLHEPRFVGNEKKYLNDAIDSSFVSSIGEYVNRFEEKMAEITGAKYAVAVVNGTAALQVAMRLAGVERGDYVITTPLTFIATVNAMTYLGADPIFLDVDENNLGLDPRKLKEFLEEFCELRDGETFLKADGRRVSAIVPVHIFGHPCRIDEIVDVGNQFSVPVVEDSAESLGSFWKKKHTGTFGKLGVFSFNGNKVVTAGGGGAIVTNDEKLAKEAKFLTTTAKNAHSWEYVHDVLGYNYRMPNLNAALACAQLEQLPAYLENKKITAMAYRDFFTAEGIPFLIEDENAKHNYWLNAVRLEGFEQRELFLKMTNEAGVMTRPIWKLMSKLKPYRHSLTYELSVSEILESQVVNIPSSVRIER